MARRNRALALIVKLVRAYHATYDHTIEQARWGVQVMRADGLVGNGSDRELGDFDPDRLQRMLDILVPIYAGQHRPVRRPLTPADLATNAYLNPGDRPAHQLTSTGPARGLRPAAGPLVPSRGLP
jgi:hypothetical protein